MELLALSLSAILVISLSVGLSRVSFADSSSLSTSLISLRILCKVFFCLCQGVFRLLGGLCGLSSLFQPSSWSSSHILGG